MKANRMKILITIILATFACVGFSQNRFDTVQAGETAILQIGEEAEMLRYNGGTSPRVYESAYGVYGANNVHLIPATAPDDTIATVLATMTNAKDAMLFERGSERRSISILVGRDSLYFGSYGTGEKPIFNGAEIITNWTAVDGMPNVWATPSPNVDENLAERTTVLIDDEIFFPVDSLNQLLGDNQYYASQAFSDSVYVYSTIDPALITAELSTRNGGITVSVLAAPYESYTNATIKNINFRQYGYGGVFVRGTVGDTVSSYAMIDNCDFFLHRYTAVYFRYSGYNTVKNCTVSYAGNGLYTSRAGARPNNFIGNTVANTISYTAAAGFTDGHAIGVYESKGALVEYNYIEVPYNGGGGVGIDQADLIVRYNEIHSAKYPCVWPYATAAGDTLDVYYNLLYAESDNGESGNWFNSTTIGAGGKINISNNTMINDGTAMGIGYGMRLWSNLDQIEFKNNIFYNDASIISFMQFVNGAASGEPISDNNLWYNVGSTYYVGTHPTLSSWTTASGQDSNSEEGNPLFISDFTDLQLQVGSPAINIGEVLGFTRDFLGNPIIGLPDAGAYEKQ